MLSLAACGQPQVEQGFDDPYEAQNRAVHEINRSIDRAILRPASKGYSVIPEPVQRGIGNFADNLDLPGSIVNDVLQANVDDAASNFTRFLINTTLGLGGVFDPATSFGLHARDSDFGETLYVWGAAEGHYVELPLMGPSTKRDAIGRIVDLFANPLGYILPKPERYAIPLSGAASKVGDRYRLRGTIDSILYDSADSYAQLRLLYLENRRFELGNAPADDYFDPYEDPYAE